MIKQYKKLLFLVIMYLAILTLTQQVTADTRLASCINKQLTKTQTTKSNLRVLNCSNQAITSLSELKELKNLEQLNLANNNLTKLDDNLTSLTKLEKLNVSGNTLFYLPSSLNKLRNLENLNANSSYLLEIPKLDNLVKLKTLFLNNNQLLILPSLKSNPLTSLELSNNLLINKNIASKNKNFPVIKQKNLKLKTEKLTLSSQKQLFTYRELFQRTIVASDNIPLYGVKGYSLREATSNGKRINSGDYLDVMTNKIYKNGQLEAKVNLKLNNQEYQTDLMVSLNLEASSSNDKATGNESNVETSKKTNLAQQAKASGEALVKMISKQNSNKINSGLKDEFSQLVEKDLSNAQTKAFITSSNIFMLSMLIVIITLIPFLIIVFIVWRIKKAKEEIEEMQN